MGRLLVETLCCFAALFILGEAPQTACLLSRPSPPYRKARCSEDGVPYCLFIKSTPLQTRHIYIRNPRFCLVLFQNGQHSTACTGTQIPSTPIPDRTPTLFTHVGSLEFCHMMQSRSWVRYRTTSFLSLTAASVCLKENHHHHHHSCASRPS